MTDWDLSLAVVAYVGQVGLDRGKAKRRVSRYLGRRRAKELIPRIEAIFAEIWAQNPPILGWTLAETAERVAHYVRQHHPELSDEAAGRIGDQMAFDWR